MRIPFTKMQGAGNDFVVLDETQTRFDLSTAQYRWLADRHFGVGADQILSVRPSPAPGIDFEYVIHNADGAEVEQCGNGARCFARFVRDAGLTHKDAIRVQTRGGVIEPVLNADGRVTVNMGAPVFEPERIPFAPGQVSAQPSGVLAAMAAGACHAGTRHRGAGGCGVDGQPARGAVGRRCRCRTGVAAGPAD